MTNTLNPAATNGFSPTPFSPDPEKALAHFNAHPDYKPSPLTPYTRSDGQSFLVKDETDRMGLGAFKALGGPYAVARLIAARWQQIYGETLTPLRLLDADVKVLASQMTFVCASAGNHGMGVASGAKYFGAKARILLSKAVPESFKVRLEAIGADVVRAGDTYEDSVAEATRDAERSGAILLADGTWPGYTEIPALVMEGYTLIAEEMRAVFEENGLWPSHVYLQAGVGGLAAAIAHMIRRNWARQPEIIIVEPEAAPCLKASAAAGKIVHVDGPESNMGRLDCKDPSLIAWHALELCDVGYQTISDQEAMEAAKQMTALGIATTPSGAAGFAALNKQHPTPSEDDSFNPLVIISECSA